MSSGSLGRGQSSGSPEPLSRSCRPAAVQARPADAAASKSWAERKILLEGVSKSDPGRQAAGGPAGWAGPLEGDDLHCAGPYGAATAGGCGPKASLVGRVLLWAVLCAARVCDDGLGSCYPIRRSSARFCELLIFFFWNFRSLQDRRVIFSTRNHEAKHPPSKHDASNGNGGPPASG